MKLNFGEVPLIESLNRSSRVKVPEYSMSDEEMADLISIFNEGSGDAAKNRELIRNAVKSGQVDFLNEKYGDTYYDHLNFLSAVGVGIGQAGAKDQTIVLPASPTGYSGAWKFDPIYGSDYYRQFGEKLGDELGLEKEEVAKIAGEYALNSLYTSDRTKRGWIGGTGYLNGLADEILKGSGRRLKSEQLEAIKSKTNEYASQVVNGLYSESDSSGFFKQTFKDITNALGPIGEIAATYFGGPLGGALYKAVNIYTNGGDFSDAIKGAAISFGTGKLGAGLSGKLAEQGIKGISNKAISDTLSRGIGGGVSAEAFGGDFSDGFTQGAKRGLLSGLINTGLDKAVGGGIPGLIARETAGKDLLEKFAPQKPVRRVDEVASQTVSAPTNDQSSRPQDVTKPNTHSVKVPVVANPGFINFAPAQILKNVYKGRA